MLQVADSPDEAYHICTKFAPDCFSGQSNKYATSSSRSTSSRSSSRIPSTRGNSKRKKQNSNITNVAKSSIETVGHSFTVHKIGGTTVHTASLSNQLNQSSHNQMGGHANARQNAKVSLQSNKTESISGQKNLKSNHGSTSKMEADEASYSDDYFDSIDESFYDNVDLHKTSSNNDNFTHERSGTYMKQNYSK